MVKKAQQIKRLMALMLCIGALPFVFGASAYAEDGEKSEVSDQKSEIRSKYFDDYSAPVGFTYNAQAKMQASYLWRGKYSGGPNIQGSANVGYGGLYFDMWWNIGVTDWTFKVFQPEVDFSLGFSRWGLNVYVLYIYNFNTPFFDFGNYANKGNRLELNVRYTLSSKIPLSFLWATRVAASDGYLDENGNVVRAYSSYAEISYTQNLRDGWSVYGAIGVTPWKGTYNPNGAALQNIEFRIRKDWDLGNRCGLMAQGQVAVSPMTAINVINLNATVGVYLK